MQRRRTRTRGKPDYSFLKKPKGGIPGISGKSNVFSQKGSCSPFKGGTKSLKTIIG